MLIYLIRLLAATGLAFFLPGWLLLRSIKYTTHSLLEQIILACSLSYGLTIMSMLITLYVAGYLSLSLIIGVLGLLNFGLWIMDLRLRIDDLRLGNLKSKIVNLKSSIPNRKSQIVNPLILVAIAAFFSLTNLGYADYWGDEMNGLLRAIAIINGRAEVIFEHTKGPAEILIPATFGLLVGQFEPFTLRFPFALAHILGIVSYYLLARRLFGQKVGFVAALLLAINGLYLAFGRMVQYQAIVFLMSSSALNLANIFVGQASCLSKYDRQDACPTVFVYRTPLMLCSFLIGVGLLAHYDMLLILPPVAYLIWQRKNSADLLWASVTLGLTVAIFYVPFLWHPHITQTSSYLGRVIGGAGWPAHNFDELYSFTVLYNSRDYALFIALLGSGLMAWHLVPIFWEQRRNPWFWLAMGSGLLFSLLIKSPLFIIALLFGLLIGLSALTVELKMIYLWVGISFISYMFFIDRPRTHLQIIYPGWSLLVTLAMRKLFLATKFKPHRFLKSVRFWGTIAACILFIFLAYYEYLLFVDAKREYIFTYPAQKASLYSEDAQFPFGSRRLYGAPHRVGWQMINQLYLQGTLKGDWYSNDDSSTLFWYTLGATSNPCYPRYYFLAQFTQNKQAAKLPDWVKKSYAPIGQVWQDQRLQIELYEFSPLNRPNKIAQWVEPTRYDSFVSPADFRSLPYDKTLTPPTPLPAPLHFKPHPDMLAQLVKPYNDPRIVNLKDEAMLLGYEIDQTWVSSGLLFVTLYWRTEHGLVLPYKVFTHLQDSAGKLWSQTDTVPACATAPTSSWRVGEDVIDRHALFLPQTRPSGEYTIQLGLYETRTGLRLDILDKAGQPMGTSLALPPITISP